MFTPNSSFNLIGITQYDLYHFIAHIGHGVICYRVEVSFKSLIGFRWLKRLKVEMGYFEFTFMKLLAFVKV